ncbi:GNAT family N-acetyltransferase [Micromonospora aurantiaca (nom. illeg.)]|uniref:GNAT family N-acetyltransferase n=1 Tax=Micromonospora aurantiaca (nom. illeg.) TaxID=47850 RepID=UPI0036CC35A9
MTADSPPATGRLTFAEMTVDDLDDMAALLGDPIVMRYYRRPKIRAEARDWIRWNEGLYRGHGFGLWVLRSRATGEFVGDCGLTPQPVDGVMEVEVGYHLRTGMQGRGFATEAAAACRDHARDRLGVDRLVAIIHPDNTPSQRVAERIGLSFERATTSESGDPVHVYAARLA